MVRSSTHFDVIIAGGGPAGSTAGYLLSKAGLNVLIIDKNRFPREKLCGGLITQKTVTLLERVFGETVDSLKQHGIIDFESNRYEIYGKGKLVSQRCFKIPFRFIDRTCYDNYLLRKADNAGTSLVEGDSVKTIDVLKSRVTTLSGWNFSADIIIGADGVNSSVRRSFSVDLFGRENWAENLAAAHEMFVERTKVKKQINHPVLYFGFVESGYAWIFPNRDIVRIGICALRNKNKKSILDSFHDFLSAMDLIASPDEKIRSYVLPYGSFLPSPVFRNIVLTGDAAGFADPLVGEGIFFAQRSAELAAQAILKSIKEPDLQVSLKKHYLESLEHYIFPEFVYGGKIRKVIFRYLKHFRWYPLKILMGLYGDRPIETIHGIRSFRWMKKI